MYCTNCGEKTNGGKFCSYCGNVLASSKVSDVITAPTTKGYIIRKNILPICFIGTIILIVLLLSLLNKDSPRDLRRRLIKDSWYSEIKKAEIVDEFYLRYVFKENGTCISKSYFVTRNKAEEGMSMDFEWEVSDDKELIFFEETYKWDSSEDEDTWYMSKNMLRIGKAKFYKEDPLD